MEQERAARSAAMARVEGIQETLRTDLEEERRARIAVTPQDLRTFPPYQGHLFLIICNYCGKHGNLYATF